MLGWFRRLIAPVLDETYTANLLRTALFASLAATAFLGVAALVALGDGSLAGVSGVLMLLEVGLLFLMRRGQGRLAGMLFSGLLWAVVTCVTFWGGGVNGPGPACYSSVIVIAGLILGGHAAMGLTLVTILTSLGMLYAGANGLLPAPGRISSFSMWVSLAMNLAAVGIILYVAMRNLEGVLGRVYHNEHALAESNRDLEARTRELETWAVQLQTATEVGRAAASVHDPDALLSRVTHLISERFGFYHVGVFLLDSKSEFAVLRASNSKGGQVMLARGHKLQVRHDSIVGYVTSTGHHRIALDVGADAVHYKNPLLPETRSELALPLKVGERVTGALDVQSREAAAFDENDVMVLQTMADQLAIALENARLLQKTQQTVRDLSSAAAEILAAMTQQASGASQQSAAVSQTTATVEQVKTISEQATARVQQVASASQRTVEVSRSGHKAVQEMVESMEQIKTHVERIASNILALSERTQQIGDIIATVNEIASQSNILALNASVEAARAGEHGKGFAVVAMEVRNLAEQSKQATAQVKAILSEIQKATNVTVMATEEGTKGVERGMQLAAQARQAINQLSSVIRDSAQAATQVVAGGQQQVAGIEQIALAMQNINQATAQSLVGTRLAEKAAQNLNGLARHLTETVEQYQA